MTNLNTMTDLYNYLTTTTYDITFVLIAYPFSLSANKRIIDIVQLNILKEYSILKINPLYTVTYEFLTITSDEIAQFYLANVTTEIPYLITYKKKYITREPWWYPCKQVSLSSPIDDINVYIKYSLLPLQRTYGNINRNYKPFVYSSGV